MTRILNADECWHFFQFVIEKVPWSCYLECIVFFRGAQCCTISCPRYWEVWQSTGPIIEPGAVFRRAIQAGIVSSSHNCVPISWCWLAKLLDRDGVNEISMLGIVTKPRFSRCFPVMSEDEIHYHIVAQITISVTFLQYLSASFIFFRKLCILCDSGKQSWRPIYDPTHVRMRPCNSWMPMQMCIFLDSLKD